MRSSLYSIVNRPTRGCNVLDRVYVNDMCYDSVRVVTLSVRSDHKSIIAYTDELRLQLNKNMERRSFRRRTPTQHAMFLEFVSQLNIELGSECDVQTNFDTLYSCLLYTSPSPRDS